MIDAAKLVECLKSDNPLIRQGALVRAQNLSQSDKNELQEFVKPLGGVAYLSKLIMPDRPTPPAAPVIAKKEKQFSVLIGTYGNFPQYSIRAVKSVLDPKRNYDIHVGCSECCPETRKALRQLLDEEKIDSLLESRQNINKDPMMRLLIDRSMTPYVLWLDDDSHVKGEWASILEKFIPGNEFDCAGHIFFYNRDKDYQEFLEKRPWWLGKNTDEQNRVWFATGGLFLAKTAFLRKHDFPDRSMVKKQDDLLLGDLISQQGGKLIGLPKEFMELIKISDGQRRGEGEGKDGWR